MNSKALLLTVMAVLTMSAVSCGKDDIENSVSMSLRENKTTESETEDSTEETAETTKAATTIPTVTTENGTETTDVSTTATDTATTTTSAETSQPEETPQQEQNEQSDNNNNDNQDDSNNNQQQDNNNNDNNGNDNQQDEPQQKEVRFSMDNLLSDASGIISDLGNPDYSGQSDACTNNGNDVKIYQYSGLSIQCYIDGDREYIFQIEITEDKYQTDKGIKVGSTRSEVESAYGTGTESGNYIIYSSGNNEMDIQYNGDTVISILFYTPV